MAKQTKKKELKFPLLEELEKLDNDLLNDEAGWELPDYIFENLKHSPRPYQSQALRYFHYTQVLENFKYRKLNQLMFNMATGSGKTDLMAGLILYLYKEKGYQNFLFTVNTNGVLTKTIDNLTNQSSGKFLFSSNLEIDGQRISVNRISGKFPEFPSASDINIKFVSVQTLKNELFTQAENVMALKDYAKSKMVILADEAHHYSASTKKKNKTEEEKASWEKTLLDLCEVNEDNLLLEFTATLDFDDESIYQKYRDKIIYRYTLDSYIRDRYSKNVRRIQSGNSNEDNMLSTVLLSEYRRRYAWETFGVEIKPVILFKSHKIDASLEANRLFNEMIESLTVAEMRDFLNRQSHSSTADSDNHNHTLQLAYRYYLDLDDLTPIVNDIKRGFAANRVINANDDNGSKKGLLEAGQYQALNSLESPTNLYRVVFAVAKLTEGWDVLNLYDIVRINNLGTTKDNRNAAATNSEAQLIGRGARYNPFRLDGKTDFQRRFDEGDETASLLLETLHYHTLNEPQYIKNLKASLDKMNLVTGSDDKNPLLDISLKPSFKKTSLYRTGKIYYNETVSIPDSEYKSLKDYGIELNQLTTISYYKSSIESGYRDQEEVETKEEKLTGLDYRYFKKAISRLHFYHFNQLKNYLPNLQSKKEFLGQGWLDLESLTLSVKTEKETTVSDFTAKEKLDIVERFLTDLASRIKSSFRKEKGTSKFIGYPLTDYLQDYKKRIPQTDTASNNKNFISQKVSNVDFKKYDFFAYQSAIINKTEESLIDAIANHIEELKNKYGNVYLIRMDENMLRGTDKVEQLKLHQFDKNPREVNLSGFQPDFILLLQNQDCYIQIFIEPKGEKLVEKDRWKEDILTYINTHQAELEFENQIDGLQIKGLKFYNQTNRTEVLEQLADYALGKPKFDGNISLNLFNKE